MPLRHRRKTSHRADIAARKLAEERLRKHTQRLEAFNRSESISLDLDLERIVQTVTDIATELSGAKFGALFYNVVDDQGEQYVLYTLSGAPREAFARFGMPRNTAIFAPTFSGSGVVRSDDIRTDPRYGKNAPHFGMPKGHLPVVSYLAVPVVSRSGQVLGGLFFGHDRPAIFNKEAEDIVKGIAAHAANAIDNARLLEAAEAEIAERRRAEERQRLRAGAELKESETRLQEALAAGHVMAFEWNRGTRQSHRSENAAEILGVEPGPTAAPPRDFLARIHPDDSSRFIAHIRCLRPDNPSYAVIFRYVRADGREVWLEETGRGEFDADGRCVRVKGLTRDITQRKRAEEQQRFLIAELDHRVKNVLSCVSAIMEHTGKSSSSIREFIATIERRIQSMANTHSLLSRGRWQGASLADLVRCELAPWKAKRNVTAVGPDVSLAAEATQATAMVLHELTTNAAKHGALSTEHGRVRVRWHRRSNAGVPEGLLLEWQEKDGPFVAVPTTLGYGTSVIRDLIPYEFGGSVDLVFASGGVRCTIEVPAKWLGDTRRHELPDPTAA